MGIKHWYYIDKDNNPAILRSKNRPKFVAYLAPKDPITGEWEDLDWLQLEDIDYDGVIVTECRVNQVTKDAVIAQRAADAAQEQADKDAENSDLQDLQRKLKDFKKNDVLDLKDIQKALALLVRATKKINKRVMDLE